MLKYLNMLVQKGEVLTVPRLSRCPCSILSVFSATATATTTVTVTVTSVIEQILHVSHSHMCKSTKSHAIATLTFAAAVYKQDPNTQNETSL